MHNGPKITHSNVGQPHPAYGPPSGFGYNQQPYTVVTQRPKDLDNQIRHQLKELELLHESEVGQLQIDHKAEIDNIIIGNGQEIERLRAIIFDLEQKMPQVTHEVPVTDGRYEGLLNEFNVLQHDYNLKMKTFSGDKLIFHNSIAEQNVICELKIKELEEKHQKEIKTIYNKEQDELKKAEKKLQAEIDKNCSLVADLANRLEKKKEKKEQYKEKFHAVKQQNILLIEAQEGELLKKEEFVELRWEKQRKEFKEDKIKLQEKIDLNKKESTEKIDKLYEKHKDEILKIQDEKNRAIHVKHEEVQWYIAERGKFIEQISLMTGQLQGFQSENNSRIHSFIRDQESLLAEIQQSKMQILKTEKNLKELEIKKNHEIKWIEEQKNTIELQLRDQQIHSHNQDLELVSRHEKIKNLSQNVNVLNDELNRLTYNNPEKEEIEKLCSQVNQLQAKKDQFKSEYENLLYNYQNEPRTIVQQPAVQPILPVQGSLISNSPVKKTFIEEIIPQQAYSYQPVISSYPGPRIVDPVIVPHKTTFSTQVLPNQTFVAKNFQ